MPNPVTRWTSAAALSASGDATGPGESRFHKPGVMTAMLRGGAGLCPCCGHGRLFAGWLRQSAVCSQCGAALGRIRADDAPPYFTIFIAGHAIIAAQLALDALAPLAVLTEVAIFVPLSLALCLGLLRPVKGATIGLMLQLGLGDTAGPEILHG